MENLQLFVNLLSKHKLIMKKYIKYTEDILNLDIEDDIKLIHSIISLREKELEKMEDIFSQILDLKDDVGDKTFKELGLENDKFTQRAIEVDEQAIDIIEKAKVKLGKELKTVSKNKTAIAGYKFNTVINKSKIFDRKL